MESGTKSGTDESVCSEVNGDPYTWLITKRELECKCGCGGLPQDSLVRILVTLREEAGFPFIFSSGYRCAKHNALASSTGDDGPHTRGLAVDIKVYGARAIKLINLALKRGVTGIGVAQKGAISSRFIHLDWVATGDEEIPRPAIWSY